MRAGYLLDGERQRKSNFWQHQRRLPSSFYDGTIGIEPVDMVIRRVKEHAYAHYFERKRELPRHGRLRPS